MRLLRAAWYRGWAYRKRYWLARALPVSLILSEPLPGQGVLHNLRVKGTLRLLEGEPVDVECSLGGVSLAQWRVGGAAVPIDISVPARTLPVGRWQWLRFTLSIRGRQRLIDSLPVRRVRSVPSMLSRQQYGAVWDREVYNRESARIAVAGYADEAEWHRSGESTAEHLYDVLGLGTSDTVLEIGCGAGRVGAQLAPKVGRWIGCDVSAQMLKYAGEALNGLDNVQLHHLNGYDLHGIEDESVDAVYCTTVFMHLEEWDRFRYVTEAARVLRPGGRLYVDNFDLRSPQGWKLFLDMAALDPAVRPPNVSKASTEQELTWYLQQAGFAVQAVETGELFVTVVGQKEGSS